MWPAHCRVFICLYVRRIATLIIISFDATGCNTQSSAPEDGQNNCPKHVELTGIINKPLLLHLFGCGYYLYQWCTVKQISDNEIYLLIKYMKSLLWRVAKCLSYIEDARCLKAKYTTITSQFNIQSKPSILQRINCSAEKSSLNKIETGSPYPRTRMHVINL